MRAIIPVAGLGSRLKPHTYSIPKVLLQVGNKPILGHILDKMITAGVDKATFVTGHLGDMIKEYVINNYPNLLADFIEQKSLDGLGHAIYTAGSTFDEKEIFIVLGDTVFDFNLEQVFSSPISALGVKTVDDPSRFGVALMENGNIKQLIEKPSKPVSNLALVGLYYIKDSHKLLKSLTYMVENDMRTRGEIQLTDALQMMIQQGEPFTTFPVDGWLDCGKPETLLETNRYILNKLDSTQPIQGVTLIPPVFIDPTATVEGSVIGPFTSIGAGAVIRDSIIKDSIIGNAATVERSLLENSIIGNKSLIRGNYKRINMGDSSELEFY